MIPDDESGDKNLPDLIRALISDTLTIWPLANSRRDMRREA